MTQSTARPKNRAKETGGKLERLLALQQTQVVDLLTEILVEEQLQTLLLHDGMTVRSIDPEMMRRELKSRIKR